MSWRGSQLLPQHVGYLTARGVTPDLAGKVGLRSVDGPEAAQLLARAKPLLCHGLAIPYPGVEPPYWRVRLDALHEGAKFMAPGGREVPIYAASPRVFDSLVPLHVVEGPIKALALEAVGLAAVGLGGTGTTLTTVTSSSERRALNDSWSTVPLEKRRLVITFDAGRSTNPNVARDEARLSLALGEAGAEVFLTELPFGPQGRDQGPDDFLAANGAKAFDHVLETVIHGDPALRTHDTLTLPLDQRSDAFAALLDDLPFFIAVIEYGLGTTQRVRAAFRQAKVTVKSFDTALALAKQSLYEAARFDGDQSSRRKPPYIVVDGCLCKSGEDDSTSPEMLANFNAKIVRETVQDDGLEERRRFFIEGTLADGTVLPSVQIEPADLAGTQWPLENWGARAIVSPERDTAPHLRCAIQTLSTPEIVRVYQHTGIRKVGDRIAFLHADGALGAEGVHTDLEGPLGRYRLPAVPEDPRGALELALAILDVGPRRTTLPLFAAAFRAPTASILPFDACLWAMGPTGSTKSTQVALLMGLFGQFDRVHLTANWSDTLASIETRLHRAKDVPSVIDDYAPKSNDSGDEIRRKAELVLRAIGNRGSRGRMRSDLTARPDRPPRGIVISTGEDLPSGESVTARCVLLKFSRETTNLKCLAELEAQRSRLPHAMAAFVIWLLARYDGLGSWMNDRFHARRTEFKDWGGHLRTPEALAHLALGIELFAGFAIDIGFFGRDQSSRFLSESVEVLRDLSTSQSIEVKQADPVQRFIDILKSLLATKSVTLQTDTKHELSFGDIGWKDYPFAYLLPEATYTAVVQEMTRGRETMPLKQRTLWDRLAAREFLLPGDTEHHTQKHSLGTGRPRVLVMPLSVLGAEGPDVRPDTDQLRGLLDSSSQESRAEIDSPARSQVAGKSNILVSPDCPDFHRIEREEGDRENGCDGGQSDKETQEPKAEAMPLTDTGPPGQPVQWSPCCLGSPDSTWGPPAPPALSGLTLTIQPPLGPNAGDCVPVIRYQVIQSCADLEAIASQIEESGEVAIGMMATGSDAVTDRPRVLSLMTPDNDVVLIDLRMTYGLGPLKKALNHCCVVGHGVVECLQFMRFHFDVTPRSVWDTKLASRILDCGINHDTIGYFELNSILQMAINVVIPSTPDAIKWSDPLDPRRLECAAMHVRFLMQLRSIQKEMADGIGLASTIALENEVALAVVEMALAGVCLNRPAWNNLVHVGRLQSEELRSEIENGLGIENANSTEQIIDALRRIDVKVENTSKGVLAPFSHLPIIKKLQQFRRSSAFVAGPGQGVLDALARSPDGRVRAQFNQLSAPTGRCSCSSPNLLGMPKLHDIRSCFLPFPDHVFIVGDYRALELRVIAAHTRDPRLLELFRQGGDPHELTARLVLEAPSNSPVSDDYRRRAKPINFGFCFGMGALRFIEYAQVSYGVTFTEDEASFFKERYFSSYAGVAAWHDQVRACPSRELRTAGGRCRVLLGHEGFPEALNTPIQGTAADGAKRSLVLLHQRLPSFGGQVVLFPHDEFVVSVPRVRASEAAPMIRSTMIEGMSIYVRDVPIEVDLSIQSTWSSESKIIAGTL